MKKIILLLFVSLTIVAHSQNSDLTNLMSGEIELFQIVKDIDNSVFGYFSISKIDRKSKDEIKYEYVLLDDSLNKVMSGEFVDHKYKKFDAFFFAANKVNDKIYLSKAFYYHDRGAKNYEFTTHRSLDLTANELSDEFYYKNGKFINGVRDEKNITSELRNHAYAYEILQPIKNGFLVLEIAKKGKKGIVKNNKQIQYIKAFNDDNKELWSYNFNPEHKNLNQYIELINQDSFIFSTKEKNHEIISSIDPSTGKSLFKYAIENKENKNLIFRVRATKDNFVILGNMSSYKASGYDLTNDQGYFKTTLDKKGNVISKKFFLWKSGIATAKLKLDKRGRMDKYKLRTIKRFTFADGSVSILTQKYKNFGKVLNESDYILLNFDEDFNLKNYKTIVNSSKYYSRGYLFSQKIKDGNGVVFFIENVGYYTKVGNIDIATIINGEFNLEQIPVDFKKSYIRPIKAKEGFVLFREYNKEKEIDKIRLERLNY